MFEIFYENQYSYKYLRIKSKTLILCRYSFSEFSALDRQLDELNSVLDAIEAKNDDIHGKLKQFLQASRQERLELQTINLAISDKTSNDSKSNDQK